MNVVNSISLAVMVSMASAFGQEKPTDLTQRPLPESSRRQLESAVEKQSELLNRLFGVDVQTTGVVPMALKSRNPLQLINPLAPAAYGKGFDNTTEDPHTGRRKGISIFGIKF